MWYRKIFHIQKHREYYRTSVQNTDVKHAQRRWRFHCSFLTNIWSSQTYFPLFIRRKEHHQRLFSASPPFVILSCGCDQLIKWIGKSSGDDCFAFVHWSFVCYWEERRVFLHLHFFLATSSIVSNTEWISVIHWASSNEWKEYSIIVHHIVYRSERSNPKTKTIENLKMDWSHLFSIVWDRSLPFIERDSGKFLSISNDGL